MAQFHFDPSTYLEMVRSEVPAYDELQETVAAIGASGAPTAVLELGTGTGETARRLLDRLPAARLTGVDESEGMLAAAGAQLPADRVDLRVQRLEDPLPGGPFDLVVSALAVHHLDGAGKADLFRRVARVLAAGGRIVVADVVVPDDPADAVTPIDGVYDKPSTVAEQLRWLEDAGFSASVAWARRDLAVLVGRLPG
jgi:tRNA (cmo5U34)-methyltransferase